MCDVEKKKRFSGIKVCQKETKMSGARFILTMKFGKNGKKNFSLFSNNGIIKKEKVLKKTTQFVSNKK